MKRTNRVDNDPRRAGGRRLTRVFLTGLAAVLPVIVTLSLLWWLGTTAERFLGGIIRSITPGGFYLPGIGIVAGLIIILLTGMLVDAWFFGSLFRWFEGLMNRIPLIKTVYGAVRDLTDFIGGKETAGFNQVVAVDIGSPPMRLIGFVTRENLDGLPAALGEDDRVAVYLPLSYQIGGYMLFIPRSALIPLDMSLEDAMRFSITAGMSTKRAEAPPKS